MSAALSLARRDLKGGLGGLGLLWLCLAIAIAGLYGAFVFRKR